VWLYHVDVVTYYVMFFINDCMVALFWHITAYCWRLLVGVLLCMIIGLFASCFY